MSGLLESSEYRPLLRDYTLKYYKNKKITSFDKKILLECEENKMIIKLPEVKLSETIKKSKFMLFECLITSRGVCSKPDRKKHNVLLLFNEEQNQVEIIDIHKFHYNGFKPISVIRNIKMNFVPWLEETIGIKGISLKDTDSARSSVKMFVKIKKDLNLEKDKDTYPLYILKYIDNIFGENNDVSFLKERFNNFLGDFYTKHEKCDTERMTNPSTGMCLKRGSKKSNSVLGVEKCKYNKFFDIVSNRCVKRESKYNINIKLNKNEKESFKNFTGSKKGKEFVVKYLSDKFPNAFLSKEYVKYKYTDKWEVIYPENFQEFIKSSKKLSVIFISLSSKPKKDNSTGFHLNALVYNKKYNQVEHFEPHSDELSDYYNPSFLYEELGKKFKEIGIKYISPVMLCPKITKIQSYENNEKAFIHTHGYCASWVVFYIEIRLSNPNIPHKNVMKEAIRLLYNTGGFKNFIYNYEKFLKHEYNVLKNS